MAVGMWAKLAAIYNRAKSANAALSLFDRAWQVFLFFINVGAAALIAWTSRTWHWYWDTFSWAGVAIAFLVSWIVIPVGFLLLGGVVRHWRSDRFWKSNTSIGSGTQSRKILKEKSIYPGTSLGCFVPPSFRATFGADTENLRLFIDEKHYVPSMGQIFWTARRRLLLREIQKVSRDEAIFIPLLSQHDHAGQKLWQWGEGGSPEEGYLYMPGATYQGRIAVTSASGQLEHCYFIITRRTEVDGGNDMPLVIGEDMFNFPAKWEAEDADNVETTSLK